MHEIKGNSIRQIRAVQHLLFWFGFLVSCPMVMAGWRSLFTHHFAAPARPGRHRCTMRDVDIGYQGSVCELLWTWPQREDSGHIALVNDWWHLQDLWSLKVVPLLKSHMEGNKSWADPCWKLQDGTWSWFISVSSLLLLGASMDGRSLWHFVHWPALSRWQEPCAKM